MENIKGGFVKLVVVNSHREGIHEYDTPVDMHLVENYLISEYPPHTTQEVALIVVGVKTDKVSTQQAS